MLITTTPKPFQTSPASGDGANPQLSNTKETQPYVELEWTKITTLDHNSIQNQNYRLFTIRDYVDKINNSDKFMIGKVIKQCGLTQLTRSARFGFAQDWSHIYDGIYRFEDNSLGEDLLAVREQALNFAKTKLSPFAQ